MATRLAPELCRLGCSTFGGKDAELYSILTTYEARSAYLQVRGSKRGCGFVGDIPEGHVQHRCGSLSSSTEIPHTAS